MFVRASEVAVLAEDVVVEGPSDEGPCSRVRVEELWGAVVLGTPK